MPNPATVREQRLRMTKVQLIDELESFERRVAACPASTIWATQSRDMVRVAGAVPARRREGGKVSSRDPVALLRDGGDC